MQLNERECHELTLQMARDTWARSDDMIRAFTEHTISFGLAAIRAPMIILSAGIIALLSFVSANSESLTGMANEIGRAFFAFVGGLVLAGAGAAFAYLTQGLYTEELCLQKRTFDHPFLDKTPGKQIRGRGEAAHALTVIAVIGSYGSFIYGAWVFYGLLARLL